MRILAALGDKALLGLDDQPAAIPALAALARRHELVITHGADAAGTLDARPIGCATPMSLYTQAYPAATMGTKVDAACRFVTGTGRRAVIGALADVPGLVAGHAGTLVVPSALAGIGRHTSVHKGLPMITVSSPMPTPRTRQPSDA